MNLVDLKQALTQGTKYEAFILAADPIVYLLQVRKQHADAPSIESPECVTDAKGQRLVFRNRTDAQQCLARIGFTEVTLLHESAYGEMIGGPVGGDSQLRHTYPIVLHD